MPNNAYLKQAGLVLRILPYIAREEVFALRVERQLIFSGEIILVYPSILI